MEKIEVMGSELYIYMFQLKNPFSEIVKTEKITSYICYNFMAYGTCVRPLKTNTDFMSGETHSLMHPQCLISTQLNAIQFYQNKKMFSSKEKVVRRNYQSKKIVFICHGWDKLVLNQLFFDKWFLANK